MIFFTMIVIEKAQPPPEPSPYVHTPPSGYCTAADAAPNNVKLEIRTRASNLCFFVFILFFLSKKAHLEQQCNKINPPLSFVETAFLCDEDNIFIICCQGKNRIF